MAFFSNDRLVSINCSRLLIDRLDMLRLCLFWSTKKKETKAKLKQVSSRPTLSSAAKRRRPGERLLYLQDFNFFHENLSNFLLNHILCDELTAVWNGVLGNNRWNINEKKTTEVRVQANLTQGLPVILRLKSSTSFMLSFMQ